jgi:hypothetical protein
VKRLNQGILILATLVLGHGTPPWQLWLFGAVAIPTGLCLWHRLGPQFGLGQGERAVSRRAAYGSLATLVIGAGLMVLFGGE